MNNFLASMPHGINWLYEKLILLAAKVHISHDLTKYK
jgi:hypothetical protein